MTENALKALGRIFRVAKSLPERALHPHRHSRALRRLSVGPRPRKILVVCHGNICRSPYLEALLRLRLPDVDIESAGFVGRGRPVPSTSLSVSGQRGLDLSRFRSQSITKEKVRTADLIVVMDSNQARDIVNRFGVGVARILIAGDLDPIVGSRTIRDPWNQPIDVFEGSFDRLDRCAANLVAALPSAG